MRPGDDPWSAIVSCIGDAAALLGLDAGLGAGLDAGLEAPIVAPERVLEVSVPFRHDDGHISVLRDWRVHHDTSRGPGKGGIHFHEQLDAHAVMSRVIDTISMNRGQPTSGVVTGKPVPLDGSAGHAGATSGGVLWCCRAIFRSLGLDLTGARTVVQGYGKVGAPLVYLLTSARMRVVAVAGVDGVVHNPAGLDPAGPEADAVLARRDIVVVPDVPANVGGVTAPYFEWTQARQGYPGDDGLVASRLRATMERCFGAVWRRSEELKVPLRRAALALGVERVAEATRLHGLFP